MFQLHRKFLYNPNKFSSTQSLRHQLDTNQSPIEAACSSESLEDLISAGCKNTKYDHLLNSSLENLKTLFHRSFCWASVQELSSIGNFCTLPHHTPHSCYIAMQSHVLVLRKVTGGLFSLRH
jgi:hypothetical protein